MLEIRDLRKDYGKICALDGLNLTLQPGEILGLVGPNGAGKTTLLKILAGLLRSESGKILIEGKDMARTPSKLREHIGYVPDFFGVYDNLRVEEYMEFYCNANGIYGLLARQKGQELLERVDLLEKKEQPVHSLSRGMKQRLCVARALVSEPAYLVLDEPASGMDPSIRAELKEILQGLSEQGTGVLISSHMLTDLSQYSTSVGLIRKGRIILQGSLEEVILRMSGDRPIVMTVQGPLERAVRLLKEHPLVETLSVSPPAIMVTWKGTVQEEPALLRTLVEAGVAVSSFGREAGSLEDVFWQMNGKEGQKK